MGINISWLEQKLIKRKLTESEKETLGEMKEYRHRQSERLIEQDQFAGELLILYAGKLDVEVVKDGVRSHLVNVCEGGVVGEMNFLSGRKRTADVIAKENCVVYALSRAHFENIMNHESQLAYDIFQIMLESSSRTIMRLDYKLLPFLKVISEKNKKHPLNY